MPDSLWPKDKEPTTISVIDAVNERRWYCPNCKRELWMPDITKCNCSMCNGEMVYAKPNKFC